MKWDYFIAYCYFEEKCKQCRDKKGKEQAHWVLNIFDDKHYWLEPGLKAMGAQGWELVAVQLAHGLGAGSLGMISYQPPHWYVFKKPLSG